MKQLLFVGVAALLLAGVVFPMFGNAASIVDGTSRAPNVIVIVTDDLGYADLGCQGSKDVKTPHIDSLAANGVRFTNGYVTSPQCGPSRAGMLSGRYQNRFGFESNEFARKPAIPTSEKLISDRMKAAGYATGYSGKWGVGHPLVSGPEYIPPGRGFDETYWNSDGNFFFGNGVTDPGLRVYRDNDLVTMPYYSTDAFGREPVEFIQRHKEEPFFLMVSFITPHVPMEAKEEDLARFPDATDPLRRTMLAMVACMDDNIGRMLETLKKEQLEEDTLIFFLSDNGGPTKTNASHNDPFRGFKGDVLEGGIHVPFIMQWKGRLPAGKIYEEPVISLDILPTTLAAVGADIQPEWELDGVNLLPFLSGKKKGTPHEELYWRFNIWSDKPELNRWAIRQGDWVLLHNCVGRTPMELHNLAEDPGQKKNLVKAQPERVSKMLKKWEAWNAKHPEPGSVK